MMQLVPLLAELSDCLRHNHITYLNVYMLTLNSYYAKIN